VLTLPEWEAPRWGSCRAVDERARNRILWTGNAVLSLPGASIWAGPAACPWPAPRPWP